LKLAGEPWAPVHPAQIQQVLLNLLINARQAMPEGGTVRVRLGLDAAGRRAELSVADTGVGIAPGDLRRIFEPFFTTKAPGGGTGLGLSICQSIVAALGGEITFESAVGRGTAFRVILPPAPSPGSGPPRAAKG
jgi:signal transduction histidine kinase